MKVNKNVKVTTNDLRLAVYGTPCGTGSKRSVDQYGSDFQGN